MDTTKRVLEEADALQSFLYDEVDPLFLPDEVYQTIDFDDDDWQEKVKGFMLPIEIEWFDLLEEIQDMVFDFVYRWKE